MLKTDLIKTAKRIDLVLPKSWTKAKMAETLAQYKSNLLRLISNDIDHHEKYSKAYFWSPPGSARSRRATEKQQSYERHLYLDGSHYIYSSDVTCSCKNVYYSGVFMVDGEKKNLSLWRKLHKKIEEL